MAQERATCWSVTINNPTQSDDDWIAQARQKSGWKVYGQLEQGESGTPHYQLMVTTPQVRFSAIKKAFPRAHIEIARDRKALAKYVQKEDTRVGQLSTQQDRYPSMSRVWSWFGSYYDTMMNQCGHENFDKLEIFDTMIRNKIREGYYVETIGVNPQVRSSVKNYGAAIAHRERSLRRQTDRQTDENLVLEEDITNVSVSADEVETCDEESLSSKESSSS